MSVKCDNVTQSPHIKCVNYKDMRKNGSRQISIQQYRFTDLFLFAIILIVSELISFYASKAFPADISISFMVPIVLVVMVRWGWPSVFYAVAAGLLDCLLSIGTVTGYQFAVYIAGNAFIGLMLLPVYLYGRDKIVSVWWKSALFAAGGWVCVYVGRSLVWLIVAAAFPAEGLALWGGFATYALADIMSLIMGLIAILVLRRLDGMFEDQMSYLRRLEREKRDRIRVDQMGENSGEIDESLLKKLMDNDELLY